TTTADGNIWVVWSSNRDDQNYEIYNKIYNESSWSPDTRLTENASVDEFPSIMQDEDDDIWVVWSSNRDGNYEIYYKIYNYTTKEWHPEELLISNPAMDWAPSIMQAQDSKIWLVWVRDNDMFHRVFFKNGPVVMDDIALTNNETTPRSSIMQAQDGKIWIAWESNRPQISLTPDIYCKIIGNGSSEERITYDNADDVTPAIMQTADGTIWIAWTSNRLDNFDIYYKTDSPPQYAHDIAILSVTHNPNKTEIRRGLNVSIEVVPQNQGVETDEITVSYYVNSTQMESQNISLSAGQVMPVKFIWETSGIAPGIYTITAEVNVVQNETDTADNIFINGAVLVRIPGDANLDGWVELGDFDIWLDNFGKKSHRCPPGLYPDFNNDGLVDMLDFFVWRENFGAH
ncbi:MAG: PD40 domain-containing protein, partial [Candidatus Bathyarchaeota archaeon]